MKFIITFFSAFFTAFTMHSASIHEAHYNPETKEVTLKISYCFDIAPRIIELRESSCLETYPQQCVINLVVARELPADAGAFCKSDSLTYDATALLPAYLTFQASDGSSQRIFVE